MKHLSSSAPQLPEANQKSRYPLSFTKGYSAFFLKITRIIGILCLVLVALMMIINWKFLPYDPEVMDASAKLAPPNLNHWFGCDNFGRDVFSRVMSGAFQTVIISIVTVFFSSGTGLFFAFIASLSFPIFTKLILKFCDMFMAFPGILLALVMVSIVPKPNNFILIFSLCLIFTPSLIRIFYTNLTKITQEDFILQAQTLKIPLLQQIIHYYLPALKSTLVPTIGVTIANIALAESGLSYLGLGIMPPQASWGKMLADNQSYIFTAPWMIIFPSLGLVLYCMGLFFLSEAASASSRRE